MRAQPYSYNIVYDHSESFRQGAQVCIRALSGLRRRMTPGRIAPMRLFREFPRRDEGAINESKRERSRKVILGEHLLGIRFVTTLVGNRGRAWLRCPYNFNMTLLGTSGSEVYTLCLVVLLMPVTLCPFNALHLPPGYFRP